jgi:hypothetical protein
VKEGRIGGGIQIIVSGEGQRGRAVVWVVGLIRIEVVGLVSLSNGRPALTLTSGRISSGDDDASPTR